MKRPIWFRRKRYGWGWVPVTWQGWLILAVYIACMVHFAIKANMQHSMSDTAFAFAVKFVICTVPLIILCYVFGEKPKWQWGNKK